VVPNSFDITSGDGEYEDTDGNTYPVDSGGIGIIASSYIKPEFEEKTDLGTVVTFDEEFQVEQLGNYLYFGDVTIHTPNLFDTDFEPFSFNPLVG
jgi:hypothetical protein